MGILPDHAHPLVRAAITAIDLFGAVSQREAAVLLGMWARRDRLTDAQVAEVLAYYDGGTVYRTPAPRPADDSSGLTYHRESDDQDPVRVPRYVDEWSATGRETGR